jgi:hypothetical protein
VEAADELFSFLNVTARRCGTHNFSFQRHAAPISKDTPDAFASFWAAVLLRRSDGS